MRSMDERVLPRSRSVHMTEDGNQPYEDKPDIPREMPTFSNRGSLSAYRTTKTREHAPFATYGIMNTVSARKANTNTLRSPTVFPQPKGRLTLCINFCGLNRVAPVALVPPSVRTLHRVRRVGLLLLRPRGRHGQVPGGLLPSQQVAALALRRRRRLLV